MRQKVPKLGGWETVGGVSQWRRGNPGTEVPRDPTPDPLPAPAAATPDPPPKAPALWLQPPSQVWLRMGGVAIQ